MNRAPEPESPDRGRGGRKETIMTSRALAATLILALAGAASARAETFRIVSGSKDNLVQFESKAAMESFKGKTHQVTGTVAFDPGHLADSVQVRVEVDMASLDTGIDVRNKHMRENHLETDTYPTATFIGGRIVDAKAAALAPGKTVGFGLTGTFTLHGVSREITVPVAATLLDAGPGRRLRVKTRFPVKLSDYDIDRPQFLLLKLADEQEVTMDLVFEPAQ